MTKLETGEHVDLDSGINVKRKSGDVFLVSQLQTGDCVRINKEDIKTVAQLSGFIIGDYSEDR